MVETDLRLEDGRTLHIYDTVEGDLPVFWHHGTPNIGAPPQPLFGASRRLGLRWISYDRPGYGSSTPRPGRSVASAAGDVASIADALGLGRFAVMGHSGGGPHALACAALLGERVVAAVSVAGLAPCGGAGLDYFQGMFGGGASLRAALAGRAAKERFEASAGFDPQMFTPADHAALAGPWAWLLEVVGSAQAAGPGPLIDDDLAYVHLWGFDPAQVTCPLLLLHGGQDRIVPASHSEWLARRAPAAERWLRPDEGHISVLKEAGAALEWLRAQV